MRRSARGPRSEDGEVARALAAHSVPTCAVLPRSGPEGDQLTSLLEKEGIDVCAVAVAGSTRSNVSLVEPDGTVTKINEPGASLSDLELDDIVAAVLSVAGQADWVVASGSLPPGVPDDFYARLGRMLGPTGVRLAVDTSGRALTAALASGPALLKPNRPELAECVWQPIGTLADAVAAAQRLRAAGAGAVLASLGADGAILVDDAGVCYGGSTVAHPRSTVGAGDAMLAGFLAAGAQGGPPSPRDWRGVPPPSACRVVACPAPPTCTATPSPCGSTPIFRDPSGPRVFPSVPHSRADLNRAMG